MKKFLKILGITIISLVVVWAGIWLFSYVKYVYFDSIKAPSGEVRDAEYAIFTYYDIFFCRDVIKQNAVVLITDKKEIEENQKMFFAPQSSHHLCGYNRKISFYNADTLSFFTVMNKDCESFDYKPFETQERLDDYVKKLETKPTHYLYCLKIPMSTNHDIVKEKLKDSDIDIFWVDKFSMRYFDLFFSYEKKQFVDKNANEDVWKKAESENYKISYDNLNKIFKNIKSIASVNRSTFFVSDYGKENDSVYYRQSVKMEIEQGCDISEVTEILKETGVNVTLNNYDTYLINVLDTSPNLEYVKNKLKKYDFITEIYEYRMD